MQKLGLIPERRILWTDGKSILCQVSTYDILGQPPPGLLDIRDNIVDHTLFPYVYRISTAEKKEQALKELCEGTLVTPTWLWKMDNCTAGMSELRYCPLCRQISLMSVCPKHKCRLERILFKWGRTNEKFFLPGTYCRKMEPDLDIEGYEEPLAKTLSVYLEMAFGIGPTAGVNNLFQALHNKGYMAIAKRYQVVLDSGMVQESLERSRLDWVTEAVRMEPLGAVAT